MKIIFLDIDGVLNYADLFAPKYVKKSEGRSRLVPHQFERFPICEKACARLTELVNATGAKIVISSTWRLGKDDMQELHATGVLDNCLHEDWRTKSITTNHNGILMAHRGVEIQEWLSRHPEVISYVILDDNSDMLPSQENNFVQTNFDDGLQDIHIERAKIILE